MLKGTVLITGFTGFVGSHMADYLLENTSCKIVGTSRWRSPKDNVQHLLSNARVQLQEMDLLDPASVNQAVKEHQPDYIMHFAAQSSPQASFKVPIQTLRVNIEGSVNLYEAIKNYGKPTLRSLIVSSSEVYGNPQEHEIPIKETNPIRAANPYSISKVGTDFMAQYYQKAFGLDMIITRMFSHEGARRGLDFALSSFAYQIVKAEKDNGAPNHIYVGNLDSIRTYIHVRDATRAYAMALDKGVSGEIYNIGGDSTYTVRKALDLLIEHSTIPFYNFYILVQPHLLRPTDITLQVPDCQKFFDHTGWTPETNLEDVVVDLLDYWRAKLL